MCSPAAAEHTLSATPKLAARVISLRAELEELSPRWEALRRALQASPVLGPSLYLGWLDEMGSRCAPFVVVLEDESSNLRALAPWAKRGPLVFSVPGRTMVTGELLLQDLDAVRVWDAFIKTTFVQRWNLAILIPHATGDKSGLDGARGPCEAMGLKWRAWPRFERNRVQPSAMTFDQYQGKWSRNRRKQIRKSRRHLERQGELRFSSMAPAAGYEVLRSLHNKRWRPGESVHWMHTEAGARIDRRFLADAPGEVLILELNEIPIAAALWLDSGAMRVALYIARDPDIHPGSPGELIFVEMLRRAFEDGVQELDLMGAGGNKRSFAIEAEPGYELFIARPGVFGAATLGARALQLKMRTGVGQVRELASRYASRLQGEGP